MANQHYRFHSGPDCAAAADGQKVRQGLLPMLGAAGGFLETSTRPNNQEAYDLYLRSVAMPHDPAPNQRSHQDAGTRRGNGSHVRARMGSVGLALLLRRNLFERRRGECFSARMRPLNALSLSIPTGLLAAGQLITNRVERGELAARPISQRMEFVKRRPESAQAHFTLAVVLPLWRHAGRSGARMRFRPGPGSG